MPLAGELSTFPTGGGRTYPFFTSGDLGADRALVFIGGLTNGMGDVPYLPALSGALGAAGWKLVQLHWTSAYDGYGTSSLDTDVSELSALVAHLRARGTRKVVIMGHSTGSQDVLHYLSSNKEVAKVDGGIMQAPVSDREHFELLAADPGIKAWLDAVPRATELVGEGRGDELMGAEFEKVAGMRMSAYRLWSLLSPSGDDDYFSTDLPLSPDGIHAHPLSTSFGRLSAPALALFSEADECAHVADIPAHLGRWEGAARAAGKDLRAVVVRGANHGVEDEAHWPVLCAEVVGWLARV